MIEALLFPLASLHLNEPSPKYYNEFNPGIIAEVSGGYLIGAYLNSHRRTTVLVGKRFDLFTPRLGVIAAACTGYRAPVCSAFTIRPFDYLEITYIPRIGSYNTDTFGFAIRVPL